MEETLNPKPSCLQVQLKQHANALERREADAETQGAALTAASELVAAQEARQQEGLAALAVR